MNDLVNKNVVYIAGGKNYNITYNDDVINVDSSTGATTLVLPPLDFATSKHFYIVDTGNNAAVNNITLVSIGGNTISGNTTTFIFNSNGAGGEVFALNQNEWLVNSDKPSSGTGNNGMTYQSNITAYAGGGQASATQLTANVNRVDNNSAVVDGSSVKLPLASTSSSYLFPTYVYNNTNYAINVYPQLGQNFLGKSANQPILVVAGQSLQVFCYSNGVWTIMN